MSFTFNSKQIDFENFTAQFFEAHGIKLRRQKLNETDLRKGLILKVKTYIFIS